MGAYRKLRVWQAAHGLAREVYALVRDWRPEDRFAIGDQLRRASTSIGANIAEGCGRNGDRELARYLGIALGSANELHYLLQLARDGGTTTAAVADPLITRAEAVCRMLASLQTAVRAGKRPAVLALDSDPRAPTR